MNANFPSKLGPFEITGRIGRGGMGAVYRGIHRESNQAVAVKLLAEPLAGDENFRQRFDLEIAALRQLRHPGIVRLLGYGQEEENYFYAMELVEGRSLEEEIRSGRRFSWQETLSIARQIASALNCAHRHGIIHRDLKPANLLLSPDGSIKLTDFGIATLFGGGKLTSLGNVIGTLNYMSPEQAASLPVSIRSDLFSFGAVLAALLTGDPPFKANSLPQIVHLHATVRALRPSQLGIEIPFGFDELIGRLLEKEPENRPKNAYLVLRILEAIQKDANLQKENSAEKSESGKHFEEEELQSPVPLATAELQKRLFKQKAGDSKTGAPEAGKPELRKLEAGKLEAGADSSLPKREAEEEISLPKEKEAVEKEESEASGPEGRVEGRESEGSAPEESWLASARKPISDTKWFEFFEEAQVNSDALPVQENEISVKGKDGGCENGREENFSEGLNRSAESHGTGKPELESEEHTEAFEPESGKAEVKGSPKSDGVKVNPALSKDEPRNFFHEEQELAEEEPSTIWFELQKHGTLIVLLLLALSIFLTAELIRFWALPPGADALYERLQKEAASERGMTSDRFSENLKVFLTFYSSDSRAREVLEWQEEADLRRLERFVLLNPRNQRLQAMRPIERDYFDAVTDLQTKPEQTLQKLRTFVIFYLSVRESHQLKADESQQKQSKDFQYLDLAKRQIQKIERILEEEKKERQRMLERETARILLLLQSEDPEEVEKGKRLCRAALVLYAEREPELTAPLREFEMENGAANTDSHGEISQGMFEEELKEERPLSESEEDFEEMSGEGKEVSEEKAEGETDEEADEKR